MAALRSRCGHYILVSFFLSSSFSSPNLSGRRLDVYHTSTHYVALVHANLECMSQCAARDSLEIQDEKMTSLSVHHRTTLSGCILATKARIDNRKKTVKHEYRPKCLHNMANFGSLTAEIGWRVWGTPSTGFASWLRYCSDVAHRRQTKHCTMLERLLGW